MINLYKPSVYSDDIKEVVKQLKNGSLSGNTSIVKNFEEKLGNYLNSKYCLALNSGTSCLDLSLKLLDVKKDQEIIVPTTTFIAPINSILYNRANPIFMDIDKFGNLDSDKVIRFIRGNLQIKIRLLTNI